MNNEIIISIKNLTTSYKDDKQSKMIHNDLNFELMEGEIVSIVGRNGCGKTTLVKLISEIGMNNIIKSGTIEINPKINIKQEVGIQFQTEDNPSDLIRAINLIKFYKKYYKNKIDENVVDEMIDIFGIRESLNKRICKMSGGQRQRLNLLLAIMHQPKILILDEFTTGLDIISVVDILKYIKKFVTKNNSSLIVVTHQPKEIKELADRVLFMEDGKFKHSITKNEIEEKYKGDYEEFLYSLISGDQNE